MSQPVCHGLAVAPALLTTAGVTIRRAILGILWLLVVFFTHELSSYRPPAATPPAPAIEPEQRTGGPRVDLYGNEVFDAVGDYRVDLHGELYERHAPDTAVLRLTPPGT